MPTKSPKPSAIPVKCPLCSRWLPRGKPAHHCAPPTEQEVVGHLTGDLREAWKRLRALALELGPQRVHASAKAVMFSRSVCYCFVRAQKSALELCIFLPEATPHPAWRSIRAVSKRKHAHTLLIQHEDQIEAPLTDWLWLAWQHAA